MRQRTLAACAVVLILVAGLLVFLRKGTSELQVYTGAGARMVAGQEIYRPHEAKPFTYPPAFVLPFVVFEPLPRELHRTVWYAINVALLFLLVRIVRETAAPARRRAVFWVLLAALALRHVLETLANQSHDLFVAFCLALAAREWGREREARAGVASGVAAALKATPLLLAVPFALQRRPRPLAAAALALAGATLLPDLLFPRDDGALWVTAWHHTVLEGVAPGAVADHGRQWSAGSPLNQSLAGTLHRLAFGRGAILAAQAAVLLAVVACTARRPVGADRRLLRLGEVGLVGCAMVLLSPMSSKSNFCVILPAAAFCAARVLRVPRDIPFRALLLGSFLAALLSSPDLVGRALARRLLEAGAITWAAVLLLAATGLAVVEQRRVPPGEEGVGRSGFAAIVG